mgnify:CR=1 FL=1
MGFGALLRKLTGKSTPADKAEEARESRRWHMRAHNSYQAARDKQRKHQDKIRDGGLN